MTGRLARGRAALVLGVVAWLSGCQGSGLEATAPALPAKSIAASGTAGTVTADDFTDVGQAPVPGHLARRLQAALDDAAGTSGSGMAATLLSPAGAWSGATGRADDVRPVRVDDQFAIASVTKSIVAAQVMQMVQAGELSLDDPASDHLPSDLDFDTNAATVRQLLGHRSGIPSEDWDEVDQRLLANQGRDWSSDWLLRLVPDRRGPAGEAFEYANANYLLLGILIEHLRRRPLAEVLRGGVLDVGGVDRLVYQPDEPLSEPMTTPHSGSVPAPDQGDAHLPFLSAVTTHGAAAAMASDAPSLARWWRALCAGEIVSLESLTQMAAFDEGYGLGLQDLGEDAAGAIGHTGVHVGGSYTSWAGCLPQDRAVVVVLSNGVVDVDGAAGRLAGLLAP